MRVPWTSRRSNQSILKEISPGYSLEGLMLKEKWMTQDEMIGRHHLLDGHEFEHAPGFGDRQGSLACCSLWGCKESDKIEWLN